MAILPARSALPPSGGEDGVFRRQKSNFLLAASDHAIRMGIASAASNVTLQNVSGNKLYHQRRRPGDALWMNNGSVSALNDIHYKKSSNVPRNKAFAVVPSSQGSTRGHKSHTLVNADKPQKRFSHVQPLVDTGKYSATKYAAHMKEWIKDNAKRPDENFRRIKASTLVQYILADAEHHFPSLFGAADVRAAGDHNSEHQAWHHRASPVSPNGNNLAGGDNHKNNNYNTVKDALDHSSTIRSGPSHQHHHSRRSPKYVLVDVRLPHDFHQNRIRTAKNYPFTRTALAHNPKDDVFRLYENHPETVLVVYDDDGLGPSIRVAAYFSERNMNNIHVLTGGLARVYELFPMLVCGKPPAPQTTVAAPPVKRPTQKHSADSANSSNFPLGPSSSSVIGFGVAAAMKNHHAALSSASQISLPHTSSSTTTPVDNRYFTEEEIIQLLECMARHSQPTISTRSTGLSNVSHRGDGENRNTLKPLLENSNTGGKRAVEKLAQRVRRQLALKKEQFHNKQQQSHDRLPLYASSSASAGGAGSESSRTLVNDGVSTTKSAAAIMSTTGATMRAEAERHRRRRPWKP